MSYSFPKGEADGFEVTLSNGVTYRYSKGNNLWQVASVEGAGAGNGSPKDYVPITGGEFVGPIFGPSVTDITEEHEESLVREPYPHDTTDCPEGELRVHSVYADDKPEGGAQNKMKLNVRKDASQYCDQEGIEYVLTQPNGKLQVWVCKNSGFATENDTVLNVAAETCYGDDLQAGLATKVWRSSLIESPYVTLEMYRKLSQDISLFNNYVSKTGGDSMEGPFTINNQQGMDSRASRRLIALNVFSGSDNSSLQLGTKNTKIYVGHNDTSFNTPLKLSEIQGRGDGITFTDTLKFDDQTVLMDIAPKAGTTQRINLFEGAGSSDDQTILEVDINGATFKKAIEFVSGPSNGKEVILRLDSNRGIRARNLNMDNTNISKLADPTDDEQAVNLRTVDSLIDSLEDRITDRLDTLITDNSSGEMKFAVKQMPSDNGDFQCMTTNGASTTYDPLETREIWAHNQNLSGYDFKWDKVEPNMYFYMAGPNDSLARFRVVAAPIDQGRWTRIKVNNPEIYPEDQKWEVNDVWDILFRTFTGDSVNLNDYVKKTGDTMTGPLEAHLHTNYIKFTGDSKHIVEDGSYRMTIDKRVIIDKGTTIPGTGFEIKGRTSEGSNSGLLYVHHNNTGGIDEVCYHGEQKDNDHLATVGYVRTAMTSAATSAPVTVMLKATYQKDMNPDVRKFSFVDPDYMGPGNPGAVNRPDQAKVIRYDCSDSDWFKDLSVTGFGYIRVRDQSHGDVLYFDGNVKSAKKDGDILEFALEDIFGRNVAVGEGDNFHIELFGCLEQK